MTIESPDPKDFQDPLEDFEPVEYGSELERALAEDPTTTMTLQPFAEVTPDTLVHRAVQVLHGLKIASLLVVDDRKLVGIFTERDVLEKIAEKYDSFADTPISEVMTRDPLVVHGDDPTGAAMAAIAAAGYRHVPVVDRQGEVLGIASPRRAFHFFEAEFQ